MSTTYEQERTEKQKEIDADILTRVRRGLDLLEEKHGPGWEDKIDLKSLNLTDASACVLGQVFAAEGAKIDENGYTWACDTFWDNEYQERLSSNHGFNSVSDVDDEWDALQTAWEFVLTPLVSDKT